MKNSFTQTMQSTLCQPISTKGIGLHSGQNVWITLRPAPENTGIQFRRIDLPEQPTLQANVFAIQKTELGSNLIKNNVQIGTVEHLMSALYGLAVDNLLVDIDASEVPILDGSAAPFLYLVNSAGIEKQKQPRRFCRILKTVEAKQNDKWAKFEPFDGCLYEFGIDFKHPVFKKETSTITFDPINTDYATYIARARTFAFMTDIEKMMEKGLALGGNLKNALVIDDYTIINNENLRYPNEFARHKLLDAIGDLYLLGCPFIGKFSAWKSGHGLNNLLLRHLLSDSSNYCIEQ